MAKDISKAVYWIVVFLIAVVLVIIGINILFSLMAVVIAVLFAPMLFTKAIASGAEIGDETKQHTDTSNAFKFNVMK